MNHLGTYTKNRYEQYPYKSWSNNRMGSRKRVIKGVLYMLVYAIVMYGYTLEVVKKGW